MEHLKVCWTSCDYFYWSFGGGIWIKECNTGFLFFSFFGRDKRSHNLRQGIFLINDFRVSLMNHTHLNILQRSSSSDQMSKISRRVTLGRVKELLNHWESQNFVVFILLCSVRADVDSLSTPPNWLVNCITGQLELSFHSSQPELWLRASRTDYWLRMNTQRPPVFICRAPVIPPLLVGWLRLLLLAEKWSSNKCGNKWSKRRTFTVSDEEQFP